MKNLTASDRKSLVKLAASLPKGSPERKAILASLNKKAAAAEIFRFPIKIDDVYDLGYKLKSLKKFSHYVDLNGKDVLLLQKNMSVDEAMTILNREEWGYGGDWKEQLMDTYSIRRWEDLKVESL